MTTKSRSLSLSRLGGRGRSNVKTPPGSLPSLPATPSTAASSQASSPLSSPLHSFSSQFPAAPSRTASSQSLLPPLLPGSPQGSARLGNNNNKAGVLKKLGNQDLRQTGSSTELFSKTWKEAQGFGQASPSSGKRGLAGSKTEKLRSISFAATFCASASDSNEAGWGQFADIVDGSVEEEEEASMSVATLFEGCDGIAMRILKHLRLKDIAAFHFGSQDCYKFCRSQVTQKIMAPTFYLRQASSVPLVDLASVEVLYADSVNIVTFSQNAEFANLLEACKSLTHIFCAQNKHLHPSTLARALLRLPELEVLDVAHNRIAVDDHSTFQRPHLLQSLFTSLPRNLRSLDLSYNLLQDEHAILLVDALESSSAGGGGSLQELSLRSNYLGNGAGFAFGQLMQSPAGAALWRLDMRTNRVEAEGACKMLEALQLHPNMREIRVGYNKQNMTEDLATARVASVLLQKALSHARSKLETLDLNNVRVGDLGVARLALALGGNSLLRCLFLAFNAIGPKGAQALSTALESNYCLRELDLRDNELGDEGAQALAQGLEQNTGLKRVLLARNGIGSHGAVSLRSAIKHHAELSIEFGASGDSSFKLQGLMNGGASMSSLLFMRDVAREGNVHSSEVHQSLMFA
eukprot:CAMPEP_0115079560 /NCGR_PEP_ID=MMETSP0227-20121206/18179_1 /TAXON_ID=89957 /ORGANISM="Polarella glacialis, Strain CCMP 1383" /LENGTH=633 /DNA_ID=CAMNT_0002467083 /DNA_START=45 /DNA_END=1949 /DNA_ORIENTATION=-